MAITMKSMNAMAALKKVGIPQHLYDWLVASDFEAHLTPTELTFKPKEGFLVGHEFKQSTVPMKISDLQKLNAGTLPSHTKNGLAGLVADAIYGLKGFDTVPVAPKQPSAMELLAKNATAPVVTTAQKEQQLKELAAELGVFVYPGKPSTEPGMPYVADWPVFDLNKMATAPTTILRDATKLYQPVKGTSANSRYYVVAANKDLRVAARWHANSLSIRIEGPGWEKHVAGMAGCGIDNIDNHKHYASMHINVADDVIAHKALGAVLMGLGVAMETPIPSLQTIKGL